MIYWIPALFALQVSLSQQTCPMSLRETKKLTLPSRRW